MGRRQKGKHLKRKRSWHHLRNQDRKFEAAIRKIDRATKKRNPRGSTP